MTYNNNSDYNDGNLVQTADQYHDNSEISAEKSGDVTTALSTTVVNNEVVTEDYNQSLDRLKLMHITWPNNISLILIYIFII